MSGKVIEFMKQQKYRFDFGTDDKLYVITFNGKIPQREIKKMLESVQNSSYGNMAGAIESYLGQHHLEYSNPVSIEIPLEKNDAMDWASHLLHSDTTEKLDGNIEDADVFYSVMDCQKISSEGCCEGCCFAVQRTAYGNGEFQYHVIGQAFSYGKHGCGEQSCFAIRKSSSNGYLQDIDKSEGEPALPTFGCVDLMALLLNMETIKTKEDAARIAVR